MISEGGHFVAVSLFTRYVHDSRLQFVYAMTPLGNKPVMDSNHDRRYKPSSTAFLIIFWVQQSKESMLFSFFLLGFICLCLCSFDFFASCSAPVFGVPRSDEVCVM